MVFGSGKKGNDVVIKSYSLTSNIESGIYKFWSASRYAIRYSFGAISEGYAKYQSSGLRDALSPVAYSIEDAFGIKSNSFSAKCIADIFLQLKKEKIALHHNDICQRKNTVLGEYTKDVAKTKLKEINHFIKKNDLKINFMLKKASI